jgi:hypothetical protein
VSDSNLGKLTAFLELENKQFVAGLSSAVDSLKTFDSKTKQTEAALTALSTRTGIAEDKIRDFAAAAQDTSKLSTFLESLRGIASEVRAVEIIITRTVSLVQDLYAAANEGARNAVAEQFFLNAGKAISKYREATHGLISDADLMKKSNLADSMGINEKTFLNLANVAQAASLKTGQSFEYMFNSIILGTSRASRLLLDNLGIIVSVKEANLHYAEALKATDEAGQYANITVDKLARSLDDQQKKAAFAEEVMRKSAGTLDEFSDIGDKSAQNFDKLSSAMDNFKQTVEKLIASGASGPIGRLASALQDVVDKITLISKFGNSDTGLAAVLSGLQAGVSAQNRDLIDHPVLNTLTFGMHSAFAGSGAAVSGGFDAAADDAKKKQNEVAQELIRWANILESVGIHAQDAANMTKAQVAAAAAGNPGLKGWIDHFKELNHEMGNIYGGARAPASGGGDDPLKTGKTKKVHVLGESVPYDDFAKMGHVDPNKFMSGMDAFTKSLNEADLKRLTFDFKHGIASSEEIAILFNEYPDTWKKLMVEAQEKADAFGVQVDSFSETWMNKLQAIWDKFLNDMAHGMSDLAQGAISGNASQGVSGIAEIGGTLLGSPEIGAAIGQFLGPLLGALDPVINLFHELMLGIGELVTVGLGPFIAALNPLGPSLRLLLDSIGVLIGAALQPLIPVLAIIVDALAGFFYVLSLAIAFLSPFVELIVQLTAILMTLGGYLLLFIGAAGTANPWSAFGDGLVKAKDIFLDAMIYINNAVVTMFRNLGNFLQAKIKTDLGLANFGNMIQKSMFEDNVTATADNTDATKSNTEAVRDLAREFRNMPSGYKVNYPIYESTAPRSRYDFAGHAGPGGNFGPRDLYRGRI